MTVTKIPRLAGGRGLAAISIASLVSVGVTSVISAAMPMALDITGYAYWQLFSLYLSFSGFFMLGLNDGIYQHFAGRVLDAAQQRQVAGYMPSVMVVSLACGAALGGVTPFLVPEKRFVVAAVASCVAFFGLVGFLAYLQQLAGALGTVATSLVIERLSLLCATLYLVATRCHDYRYYVAACVSASLVRLVFLAWSSRHVLLPVSEWAVQSRSEVWCAIRNGFPIMLSIVLSASIVVPSRLVVESSFGPVPFALYSFALTVVFVAGAVLTSVAQAAYPMLARVPAKEQGALVRKMHATLVVLGSLLMLGYFVAAALIRKWYPSYAASLGFLALLFPLLMLQNKYVLLLCNLMRARGKLWRMTLVATSGIVVNWIVAESAAVVTESVAGLSSAVLLGYFCWLIAWWRHEMGGGGPFVHSWDIIEVVVAGSFLLSVAWPAWLHLGRAELAASVGSYSMALVGLGILGRRALGEAARPLLRRFGISRAPLLR